MLVNKCVILIQNYIIGVILKPETGQLHMFGENANITAVKNTLRKRFDDNFLMKFVTHQN